MGGPQPSLPPGARPGLQKGSPPAPAAHPGGVLEGGLHTVQLCKLNCNFFHMASLEVTLWFGHVCKISCCLRFSIGQSECTTKLKTLKDGNKNAKYQKKKKKQNTKKKKKKKKKS